MKIIKCVIPRHIPAEREDRHSFSFAQGQLLGFDRDYQRKIIDLQRIEDLAKEKVTQIHLSFSVRWGLFQMREIDAMNDEWMRNLHLANEYFQVELVSPLSAEHSLPLHL